MKWAPAAMKGEDIADALGLQPFQGRQIFRWLHQKRVFDFDAMTDLSKAVRAKLHETCIATQLTLVQRCQSPHSGTKKVLLRLVDGETIESVLIRDGSRLTLCLSSQVGCALNCRFCATGQAGFRRDLEVGEIVEQALFLLADESLEGRTPNIVFMGMGEPFRNYDPVMESIRLLMEKDGLGVGARKITVSTAGEAPGIERFANEDAQLRLSVSLHAANDALRSKLMPLNRRYPLGRLREALECYAARTGRQFTFEWVLLGGVNDSPEDAAELARYTKGLNAVVNLIPWNPVPGIHYHPSLPVRCHAFQEYLASSGVKATLRQEKGQDIEAACGQLRQVHGV